MSSQLSDSRLTRCITVCEPNEQLSVVDSSDDLTIAEGQLREELMVEPSRQEKLGRFAPDRLQGVRA